MERNTIGSDATFPTLAPGGQEAEGDLAIAGVSHPGRVRDRNDDHYIVARIGRYAEVRRTNIRDSRLRAVTHAPEATLLAVADGLGGHSRGDLASVIALDTVIGEMLPRMPALAADSSTSRHVLLDIMSQAARVAQTRVEDVAARKHLQGPRPGTTLTVALVREHHALVMHVGDSRAYLVRDGETRRLTHDHTAGRFIRERFGAEPAPQMANLLVNAVGGDTTSPEPEIHDVTLEPADVLVLATDGITQYVNDDELALVVSGDEPGRACDKLLALALSRGGEDNATVIVARVRSLT